MREHVKDILRALIIEVWHSAPYHEIKTLRKIDTSSYQLCPELVSVAESSCQSCSGLDYTESKVTGHTQDISTLLNCFVL
jgi:hypothetical protein